MAFTERGEAWMAKREYEKAIADFDESIRLQPWEPNVYFHRAVSQLTLHRHEAVASFRTMLELDGGKGRFSPYAIIFGHFAARRAGTQAMADQFLELAPRVLNVGAWPYPVIKHLRGEIGEPELLAAAIDDDKRTEAHCYLGLDHEIKGEKDKALDHFRWVRDHGNRDFFEYPVALAELVRLENPKEV